VRMAMGADRGDLLRLVLRRALLVVAVGVAAGCVLAIPAGRLIASRLYGVSPLDPAVFAAAIGLMLVVGLASAWIPARRAVRIDPIAALRYEA